MISCKTRRGWSYDYSTIVIMVRQQMLVLRDKELEFLKSVRWLVVHRRDLSFRKSQMLRDAYRRVSLI